jgi:hypothetical protein
MKAILQVGEKGSSFESYSSRPYLCIDQLLIRFGILMRIDIGTGGRFLSRFPTVKLRDDLGVDPVELFLRENTKKRPSQIQRIEDSPRLVRS